ncbi:MAG: DUF3795 domain-containing protein [Clostridiales bacterium]|nr:DUF3795 domain-containing protein [Clostridiales bacterium]MDD7036012.1 DUF3795 domain-containing protein [Bacillota bacterium]MDY2921095.1 DUF3795 domain-containing protein [Lentihominibacter sp.]
MRKTIAYCGLDCERCDAYIATVNDDDGLREKTAKLWSELNNVTILPEDINCEGCRVDGRKAPYCDGLCEIRKCAMDKGVGICGDCPDAVKCSKVDAIIGNNAEARRNILG